MQKRAMAAGGHSHASAPLMATGEECRASTSKDSDFSRKARNLDLCMKSFHTEINCYLKCFENLKAKHTTSTGLHTWLWPSAICSQMLTPAEAPGTLPSLDPSPEPLIHLPDGPRPPQVQKRALGSCSKNGTFLTRKHPGLPYLSHLQL